MYFGSASGSLLAAVKGPPLAVLKACFCSRSARKPSPWKTSIDVLDSCSKSNQRADSVALKGCFRSPEVQPTAAQRASQRKTQILDKLWKCLPKGHVNLRLSVNKLCLRIRKPQAITTVAHLHYNNKLSGLNIACF